MWWAGPGLGFRQTPEEGQMEWSRSLFSGRSRAQLVKGTDRQSQGLARPDTERPVPQPSTFPGATSAWAWHPGDPEEDAAGEAEGTLLPHLGPGTGSPMSHFLELRSCLSAAGGGFPEPRNTALSMAWPLPPLRSWRKLPPPHNPGFCREEGPFVPSSLWSCSTPEKRASPGASDPTPDPS